MIQQKQLFMLNYMFSLPIGLFIFLMNLPLFFWGAKESGIAFLIKTIVGTLLVSIAIDVLNPILPVYKGDTMLASIFGGVLNGAGLGLIFYRGGSTGGTDIIALILHNFVYNSLESALYAGIAIFVSIRVIDAISYGTSRGNGKLMFIITNKYDEVSTIILNNLKRGVTLLDGEGAYSGIKKIDKNAFIIVTTAGAIQGSGFAKDTV